MNVYERLCVPEPGAKEGIFQGGSVGGGGGVVMGFFKKVLFALISYLTRYKETFEMCPDPSDPLFLHP